MAANRLLDPVLHCKVERFNSVSYLAKRLILSGLYFNVDTFDNPTVAFNIFKPAVEALDKLILKSKSNRLHKNSRTQQCRIVFSYIKTLLQYVKIKANHDAKIIALSGFDPNKLPEKQPPPDKPSIRRVVEGKEYGTYKIYLVRNKYRNDLIKENKRYNRNVTYTIEISTNYDDPDSWVIVRGGCKSTDLVFKKITRFVVNYIRVTATSGSVSGQPSNFYSFVPQ